MKARSLGLLLAFFSLSSELAPPATAAQAPAPKPQSSPASQAAITPGLLKPKSTTDILPVERAFRIEAASITAGELFISLKIAAGYYLYRDKLSILSASNSRLTMSLPKAITLHDEFLGDAAVYFDTLELRANIKDLPKGPLPEFQLYFQGCAQDRYCYPPNSYKFTPILN